MSVGLKQREVIMFNKTFWVDALERAVKTFAQTLVALWTAGQVASVEVLDNIDFSQSAKVAGLAAAVSVLTSVASANFGSKGTASLVDGE